MKHAKAFNVLGIDPGRTAGACLLRWEGNDCRVIIAETVGSNAKPCDGSYAFGFFQNLETHKPGFCATEDQFIPPGKHSRAMAVGSLVTAAHAGGWRYLARSKGWAVMDPISPARWRRGIYGPHRVRKRDEYKAAAILQVKLLYDLELGHDCAEAVLIATYAARSLALGIR